MWLIPPQSPSLDALPRDAVQRLGTDLLTSIQEPRRGQDARNEERRLAAELAARAGDRQLVERLRSHFIRRLHRPGPDPAGTAALRVSEAALRLMPRTASSADDAHPATAPRERLPASDDEAKLDDIERRLEHDDPAMARRFRALPRRHRRNDVAVLGLLVASVVALAAGLATGSLGAFVAGAGSFAASFVVDTRYQRALGGVTRRPRRLYQLR